MHLMVRACQVLCVRGRHVLSPIRAFEQQQTNFIVRNILKAYVMQKISSKNTNRSSSCQNYATNEIPFLTRDANFHIMITIARFREDHGHNMMTQIQH